MKRTRRRRMPKAIMIVLLMTLGCDDGVARIAREGADRQAKQNETMATLQQEVAKGSRMLVEEEGAARRQSLRLQRDLQSERANLTAGWNDLEIERQRIAASRRTDSVVAAVLQSGAATLAAVLALAFAYLAIFGLSRTDESAADAPVLLLDRLLAAPQPRESEMGEGAVTKHKLGDSTHLRSLSSANLCGTVAVLDSDRDS